MNSPPRTYAFERELEKLHPDNRNVRDNPVKDLRLTGQIRQQLQILRDRVVDSH